MVVLAPAAATPMAANTNSISTTPTRDITSPAMAKPLGTLNIPTAEKIRPNNHKIHPRIGIHPKNRPQSERINPVRPMPFFCGVDVASRTCPWLLVVSDIIHRIWLALLFHILPNGWSAPLENHCLCCLLKVMEFTIFFNSDTH